MVNKKRQILIVDDEASIRMILKKLLKRNGYECHEASDSASGRTIIEKAEIDLVLSDINMPGESGLSLIRYIKKTYPEMAIIMVTIIGDHNVARTALDIGIYGYIIKPFDENQVLINVDNALRRRDLEVNALSHRKQLEKAVQQATTKLIEKNKQLKHSEKELKSRTLEIEEVNNALRVLLKRTEEDKSNLEEQVLNNVKKVTLPYLNKLKNSKLNSNQTAYLNIIETNLKEITSPLVKKLSSKYLNLTPTEIQIANLIKTGARTKEIAEMLNLSENTIVSHRYKIRTKLDLKNKKTNLCTFLQSLE